MKPIRITLLWLLITLLLLPSFSFAETHIYLAPAPTPEETPEPTPTPTPTPPFGISLGYTDEQRQECDSRRRTVFGSARADGVYVADASDLSLCFYSKHADNTYPNASTTKIMTALLAIEALSMDEVIITPREATLLGGTNTMLGLVPDEPMSVEDLLYGLMLVSGNDCAITLAYRMDGSEEAFAERMNARAAELGMVNTNFTNPCGHNVGDNHSSPYDLAILTQEALKNEQFRTIVATADHTIPANEKRRDPLPIRNSNRLVSDGPPHEFYCPEAIGVKTGSTALGTCLVAAAKREDVTIIVVQLGLTAGDSKSNRLEEFGRALQFFNYIFDYEYTDIDAETMLGTYTDVISVKMPFQTNPEFHSLIVHADTNGAHAYRAIREMDLLLAGDESFDVDIVAHAEAPVEAGQQVGTATFSYRGRVWFTLPLIADKALAIPATPTPIPTPEPTEAPLITVVDVPVDTPVPTDVPTPTPTEAPMDHRQTENKAALQILLPLSGVLLPLVAALLIRKRIRDRK